MTRFYLPSTGATDISPTVDAEWDVISGFDRVALVRNRINSAMADKTVNSAPGDANRDVLWRQYVSEPLAAQTISGTVKGRLRTRESNAAANARMQVIIRVVSEDGSTVRGTLYGGDLTTGTTNPTSEFAVTATAGAGTNRQAPRGASQALSSVNALNGDRIVIEFGWRIHAVALGYSATGIFGDDSGTDLPENESTTTANNPWIEFSGTIDPKPPPPVPLPDLTATYRPPTSVLIADPGGFHQLRVPVTGVPRSWVVGGSGALSGEIMSRDLVRFGLHGDLRGHEIVVHDDDTGTWGGIITDVQPNGDGTTEIAATSWEASFAKKRLPRRSRALFGPAGTLALNAITEATRETGTAINQRTATDFGVPVTLNYDGGDLLAALDSMASETGQEWWVDADTKAFTWGVKGRDLTGSVHLIAGRHIVNWRMPTSLDPVINDLQAFPTNDDHAVWQTVRVTNPASIAAVGVRQGSVAIPGGTHAVHIRGRAQGLVNELAALGHAIEFDLANVDRCFRWFREGDQICITVPSVSVQLTVRVMARSINDDGTMSVSADVLTRRIV